MKKIFRLGLLTAFLVSIISSCSTTNNVVSDHRIQKRKYNKGYFVSPNNNNVAFNKKSKDVTSKKIDNENNLTPNVTIDKSDKSIEAVIEIKKQGASESLLQEESVDLKNEKSQNKISKINVVNNEIALLEVSAGMSNTKRPKLKTLKNKVITNIPADDTVMFIVMVILAFLIPPLAVYLFEETSKRFWIDLIMALIGWGVGIFLFGPLMWLGGVVAIIYALLIVLEAI